MYHLMTKFGRWLEAQQVRVLMRYGLNSYQPDPFGTIRCAGADRDVEGTVAKWSLLRRELPVDPYSALDLGCNIGYFSFKMAASGADHVVGFDTERGPILVAEKLKTLGRIGNVGFLTYRVTPGNAVLLGTYDVVLFMSVFHHLVYAYDIAAAKGVLQTLISKTRRMLFFETGLNDQGFGRMALSMPDMANMNPDEFVKALLYECGAEKVEWLGRTDLKRGVKRSLYKVTPGKV